MIRNLYKYLLLICITFSSANSYAQEVGRHLDLVSVGGAVHLPLIDMGERFGTSGAVKVEYSHIFPSSLSIGIGGGPIFGETVKEDVLVLLKTPENRILGLDGRYGLFELSERGFMAYIFASKLFPVIGPNQLSGLYLQLATGLIQHRIKITDLDNSIPQIQGEYEKGYDRLCNGISVHQFIAYQYMSNNRRINFRFGLDLNQGFTSNRRDFDFATQQKLEENRFDVLFGLRFDWIIPFYGKRSSDFFVRISGAFCLSYYF